MAERNPDGTWAKGYCPNPGGRPRNLVDVQALAREHTTTAVKTLAEICKGTKYSAPARVQAAQALLDRGWGKPHQSSDVTVAGDGHGLLGVLSSLSETKAFLETVVERDSDEKLQ